jgi:DNA-binding GntR family transcriptional regulator
MSRLSRWYYVSLVSARAVDALDEHVMIADAIIAGDGDAARELMHRHIDAALSAFARQTERRMESNHPG